MLVDEYYPKEFPKHDPQLCTRSKTYKVNKATIMIRQYFNGESWETPKIDFGSVGDCIDNISDLNKIIKDFQSVKKDYKNWTKG